jgi:DNA repair protein RadC
MLRGKNILVIDDDKACCQLISEFLTQKGALVQKFTDISAARSSLNTLTPDISIVDYNMPEQNGIEFFNSELSRRQVATVMISGGGNEEPLTLFEQSKKGAALLKPFTMDALEKIILDLVNSMPESMDLNILSETVSLNIQMKISLNLTPCIKISSAEEIYRILSFMGFLEKEILIAVLLNEQGVTIGEDVIAIGGGNAVHAAQKEIFRAAVRENAAGIILAHNHPSGSLEISNEDKLMTFYAQQTGHMLGIKVLDHIVIAQNKYISIIDPGMVIIDEG